MDNSRDKLDRLIDGALAGYSDAEPLEGLEERVLNRARVAQASRRRVFACGLGIAAAAAGAMIAIVVETRPEPVARRVEVARVTSPAPEQTVAKTPAGAPQSVRAVKRSSRLAPLPKLEQFPAPAPLTAEERALIAFVRRDPKEAEQIFAGLRKQADQPIEIQPIEIAPLRSDEAQ